MHLAVTPAWPFHADLTSLGALSKEAIRLQARVRRHNAKRFGHGQIPSRSADTRTMKEAMALKTLNEYHIEITRQQIDFARNRMKEIRANNKRKRVHRKERKQRLLEEKEYQAYKEDVCLRFMETGQVYTLEEYAIIKEEFF